MYDETHACFEAADILSSEHDRDANRHCTDQVVAAGNSESFR